MNKKEMLKHLLGNSARKIMIDTKELEYQLESQSIDWKLIEKHFRCIMCQADNTTNDNICEYCGCVQNDN